MRRRSPRASAKAPDPGLDFSGAGDTLSLMMVDTIEIAKLEGETLRGRLAKPLEHAMLTRDESCLMVMVHDFPGTDMFGHDDIFGRLENSFDLIGIDTLRFDFRGFGLSDGEPEVFTLEKAIIDLKAVYEWAKAEDYSRLMITVAGWGHLPVIMSMPKNVHALALLWPVMDARDFAVRNLQAESLQNLETEEGHIELKGTPVSYQMIRDLYELDTLPFLSRVTMPSLILHGAQDGIVPVEQLDLARAWFRTRRIEITTYHDGVHGLPKENHRKYLYFHYEQFVRKYI